MVTSGATLVVYASFAAAGFIIWLFRRGRRR